MPFEDPDGTRYWVTPSGERVPWLSIQYKYAWIEQYSHELHRPFFFNQETLESTWVRPADLAWRRIRLKE